MKNGNDTGKRLWVGFTDPSPPPLSRTRNDQMLLFSLLFAVILTVIVTDANIYAFPFFMLSAAAFLVMAVYLIKRNFYHPPAIIYERGIRMFPNLFWDFFIESRREFIPFDKMKDVHFELKDTVARSFAVKVAMELGDGKLPSVSDFEKVIEWARGNVFIELEDGHMVYMDREKVKDIERLRKILNEKVKLSNENTSDTKSKSKNNQGKQNDKKKGKIKDNKNRTKKE